MPTLLTGTPLLFYYLTFKEDKATEKPIVALRDHESAPYDQTVYTYQKSNEGEGGQRNPPRLRTRRV